MYLGIEKASDTDFLSAILRRATKATNPALAVIADNDMNWTSKFFWALQDRA
jgi:hypothetical protein